MSKSQPIPQLLLISGYPPSTVNGGGVILRNLLTTYSQDDICVITNERFLEDSERVGKTNGLLKSRCLGVKPLKSGFRGLSRIFRFINAVKILTTIFLIKKNVNRNTVMLVVPWAGELASELTVSAYLASRLFSLRFIVYEMDDWKVNIEKAGWTAQLLERCYHRKLLKRASRVWVISEKMADAFKIRYGIGASVLPHCVDISKYKKPKKPKDVSRCYIYYTGAIYGAQADAVLNVIAAIEDINDINIVLVVYTNQTKADLAALGISKKKVVIKEAVPVEEIPEILSKADILLLPFSFRSDERAVVSSSYPTKTADYLASGVPILVHAPPYSTIAENAKNNGWGIVVDEPKIDEIKDAIISLFKNDGLRAELSLNARRIASEKHDLNVRRRDFHRSIYRAAEKL